MRSFDQFLAMRNEIPAPRWAEARATLSATVLGACRDHRRQFLPLHRDLHQDAPSPAERRRQPALEAGARPYRDPLHPFRVSIGKLSSGCSAATPPLCMTSPPILRGELLPPPR
jgi:hypothetical protein